MDIHEARAAAVQAAASFLNGASSKTGNAGETQVVAANIKDVVEAAEILTAYILGGYAEAQKVGMAGPGAATAEPAQEARREVPEDIFQQATKSGVANLLVEQVRRMSASHPSPQAHTPAPARREVPARPARAEEPRPSPAPPVTPPPQMAAPAPASAGSPLDRRAAQEIAEAALKASSSKQILSLLVKAKERRVVERKIVVGDMEMPLVDHLRRLHGHLAAEEEKGRRSRVPDEAQMQLAGVA